MDLWQCPVVVTGAASGLGAETARHLAEAGAKVTAIDIDAVRVGVVGNAIAGWPYLATSPTRRPPRRRSRRRARCTVPPGFSSTAWAWPTRSASSAIADRCRSTTSAASSRST